ncbi:hypothetical protein Q1695_001400 [Nippostrongylus brasiliensis]|nr:hypothetical protein Q1695_001400 [Nippostrongylus brasiliensis]
MTNELASNGDIVAERFSHGSLGALTFGTLPDWYVFVRSDRGQLRIFAQHTCAPPQSSDIQVYDPTTVPQRRFAHAAMRHAISEIP